MYTKLNLIDKPAEQSNSKSGGSEFKIPSESVSTKYSDSKDKKRDDKYKEKQKSDEINISSSELELIKANKLGNNKKKRKLQKPSEKFRKIYVDDWNPEDDTTQIASGIGVTKYQPKPLFGKGHIVGVENDVLKEEKKSKYNDEIPYHKKQSHEMTNRDWMIFREDNDILVQGTKVPPPLMGWRDLNAHPKVLDAIRDIGYEKPSPIQMQAIPVALDKRDLVGIAPTGMGKSCAFLTPMIDFFMNLPKIEGESINDGPYGLILAPTRELAIQIENEFLKLSKYTHLRTACLIGGRSASEQSTKISRGCEVIIGTPGRILDCLKKRLLVLNQCFYLILDEADKMIEMDLVEDVTSIIGSIEEEALTTILSHLDPDLQDEFLHKLNGRKRMINLYSATISQEIRDLAKDLLSNHVFISIGEPGSGKKEITQNIEFISHSHKTVRTIELLKEIGTPVLIFMNHKADTEKLSNEIEKNGFRSAPIHGGKTQERREASLLQFKKGKLEVLVCTNVLARGIDIDDVKHVINYDCPNVFHDYVHRIGRTGRAGKSGIATTFIGQENSEIFPELKKFLEQNGQRIPKEFENIGVEVFQNIKD